MRGGRWLRSATHVPELLSRVSKYGAESAFGYDHASMQHDAPFTTEFTVAFFRAYDMADLLIEVLRSDVVTAHQHVDKSSLLFRINLPATMSAQTPVAGANQAARSILNYQLRSRAEWVIRLVLRGSVRISVFLIRDTPR